MVWEVVEFKDRRDQSTGPWERCLVGEKHQPGPRMTSLGSCAAKGDVAPGKESQLKVRYLVLRSALI